MSSTKSLVTPQIGNTPLKDRSIQPTWSNAYKDLGGFGLVITVTLPVVVGTSESERMVTKVANNNSVSLLGMFFNPAVIKSIVAGI